MAEIITATQPTPEGEMLWRVTFTGSYWDNDPRMPSDIPVERVVFVLAKGLEEAKRKAEPHFKGARKRSTQPPKVEAHIATGETFLPVEEKDEALSSRRHYLDKYRPLTLADPEDAKRYRLAVCLVPVEES